MINHCNRLQTIYTSFWIKCKNYFIHIHNQFYVLKQISPTENIRVESKRKTVLSQCNCVFIHQDWTNGLLKDAANFLSPQDKLHFKPHFSFPNKDESFSSSLITLFLLQPLHTVFITEKGTDIYISKFMADEEFSFSMESLCPINI